MPSVFPGMDPYLESPRFWSDFHDSFIPYAREDLQAQLPERYRARLGEWVAISATQRFRVPDISVVKRASPRQQKSVALAPVDADEPLVLTALTEDVEQPFIEIVDRSSDRVVTAIELLSLVNKTGDCQARYRDKQRSMLQSFTNLVEIDLLHGGEHTVVMPEPYLQREAPFHSVICTWRASSPQSCELYFVRLQGRLPRIRIPLLPEDQDIVCDVQAVMTRCYDVARYKLDIIRRKICGE